MKMENLEKIESIKRKTEIIRNICFKRLDEFNSSFDDIDENDESDAWKELVEEILQQIDRLYKYTQQF